MGIQSQIVFFLKMASQTIFCHSFHLFTFHHLIFWSLRFLAYFALESQGVVHVFVTDVNVIFPLPWLNFAIWTSFVSCVLNLRNIIEALFAKYSFAFAAFHCAVNWKGVTYRADNHILLQHQFRGGDPSFINMGIIGERFRLCCWGKVWRGIHERFVEQ